MTDTITKRWIRTAADEQAVAAGCYFDEAAAERVPEFFRRFLRHSKGKFAGNPFELLPWQTDDVIYPLYGWKRPDGTRRFRKAYVEIPKKNGKSTMASGIGLYHLAGDGERGAEVYSAAVTRDQASIVHGEAITMVESSEALASYLKINKATKEILFPRYASKYKALPAEAHSSEGLNASALIIDELHAWIGEHGRRFYDALKYAGTARTQPLMFQITTAGEDTLGVCWEQHEYARDVIAGVIDDQRFFGYIAAADVKDDVDEPATWRKANPSMGVTMTEADFAADLSEAKKTPSTFAQFLRYRLNRWAGGGGVPAIRPEDWNACEGNFTVDDLAGRECWAALDLSRTKDMTALALVFRAEGEGGDDYHALVWFWLPAETLERKDCPEQFRTWAKQGRIRLTDGNVTDYTQVENDIVEILERFAPQCLAFDPYFAEEITQRIMDRIGVERVEFRQTLMNFAPACTELERLVMSRKIRHDGDPVLAWHIANLRWKIDANNNKRPIKPGGDSIKKIDGAVAMLMGIGRAMTAILGGGGMAWA